ncbi:MAG: type I restriction endonuclease subunit R [Acidimicrobiia bacterium]|nr:type I restriction endonuclease subunit R [Acidimicrobiia bacterium]MYC57624.1 type I restriction endonuclease subunit R [Acidimicrobiia bacterium]MYI30723.1 type I restriction endonuclease subunit R [Acidimicrobiia bacterium]
MSSGPEWERVERPLLEHLSQLGWETLVWGEQQEADAVGRDSERDVLLEQRLGSALGRINPGPEGEARLDESRIKSAIAELRTAPGGTALLEANQSSTELLLGGFAVPGLDGGREQIANYICWDDWSANDFLAVSQFRVATPGSRPNIRPDVTLFVNGIPLVVIEAKPPGTESGITDAIDQLRRYANQRGIEVAEGAEQLFWTNQFTVATTGERAEAGTFSALPEHYLAWKDPYPTSREEVAASLGMLVEAVTQQEILTVGMLAPERLLDIVRHFTLFKETGSGRTIKLVCRYQQYRGVLKALHRLRAGTTRAEDGYVDRRGGIIWHTQGSGKSLTMVFLIRAMRSDPELRKFKIVLVTDRTDLEIQLRDTAALTGETVKVARSAAEVRELLSQPGPGVVMAMIQKYRDTNGGAGDGLGAEETFGMLNDSESFLVMVDEAHRSQASTLHANLMAAVPNAARIGFTGTPIIMGKRKKTLEIFGDYIDRYTLAQSEADESTVPIFYEGRTTDAAVSGASRMDEVFFRWFRDLTEQQREVLQKKYATTAQVLEAPELIAAKAKDILRHYIATVMPDGFKGMIVATSREACLRYYDALNTARDELVVELDQRGNELNWQSNDSRLLDLEESFLRPAAEQVDLIRALEFAPVISGDHNDPPHYADWTDKLRQQVRINSFKLPLGVVADGHSPLGILIVKSMLLTGFDAPWAQALYLDRMIQEAELLQAVARVNRTAPKKTYGLVVDYYGVSSQLTKALAAYAGDDGEIDPDVEGALRPLTAEIEKLEPQRQRVRQLFVQRGVEPASTEDSLEACVWLLRDERLRTEFDVALRTLLTNFDTVLPRPEALPFVDDANLFAEVQIATRRRYRDTPDGDFDPFKYKEKVRRLIDEHITVLDLSQKIPSVRITDPDFRNHIQGINSDRAKASEMEHAARHHIREHLDEDPSYYGKLSKRIDEILERFEDRWDQMALEFEELIAESNAGRIDEDNTGLDPTIELPFHGMMVEKVNSSVSDASEQLITLTRQLVADVRRIISNVGFWDNATKQDELRKAVKRQLDGSELFEFNSLDELAVELVDLAKANQQRLA